MIDDNPCDRQLRSAISARDVLEQLRIEERARRNRLEALCRKLAEACVNLEWIDRDSFFNPRCPDCCGLEKQGHMDDCKLFAALSEAKKMKETNL